MKKTIARRLFNEEKGQTVVLFALLLVVLLGITALSVDVGYLQWKKRHLQNTADAAALAGAVALRDSGEDENEILTAVQDILEANGYKDYDLIDIKSMNEVGQDTNMVYLLPDNQVHVRLSQPESWFFAKVLSSPSGGALVAPVVGSHARAEVFMSPGGDIWGRTFISFDKYDGSNGLEFSGDVGFNSENISVHSNCNIVVNGNKLKTNYKGEGSCVGKMTVNGGNYDSLFSSMEERVEPLESPFRKPPFENLLGKITEDSDLKSFFPDVNPNNFICRPSPGNESITLILPGPGVVYLKGELKSNASINIDTNGGLVFIEGNFQSNSDLIKIDGILYVTGDVDISPDVVEITGGLWSEGTIKFHGNTSTISHQKPDPSLGLLEGIPAIRLVQ